MVKKNTKHALLMSVLSLLLCCSMLIGTTFAWFTDTVESGINKITAGNLDVEVYHSKAADPEAIEANKVTGATNIFTDAEGKEVLWEPGVVAYTNLKVVNEGSLALKYQLAINFENATEHNGHSLAEALKVGVVKDGFEGTTRAAVLAEVTEWQTLTSFNLPGTLAAGNNDTYGIVIYWEPTENDNWFNMNNENQGKVLSIDLGLKLVATQKDAESDSFGNDYDKNASVTVSPDGPMTLAEAIAQVENGGIVFLEPGEYTLNSMIVVDGKSLSIIGLGDVYITTTANQHMFTIQDQYDPESDVVVNLSNLTLDGKGVSKHGINVKYNVTVNMENVTVKNTGWAGVLLDNANMYNDGKFYEGTATRVNMDDCDIVSVSLDALPVVDSHSYANAGVTTYAYLNYDPSTTIGSLEIQKINKEPVENIFINGVTANTIGTTMNLYVKNDAELAEALNTIKTNDAYWNKQVYVYLAAGTYSGDYVINQYPQWNGVVGAGNSGNNYASGIPAGAPNTVITFIGEAATTYSLRAASAPAVVFTGKVTVNGFGNAGTGFDSTSAITTFQNVAFDGANIAPVDGNVISVELTAAADNVYFENCAFQNTTHVVLGYRAENRIDNVYFTGCTFTNAGSLSGYPLSVDLTDCVVDGADDGFLNIQNKATVSVTGTTANVGRFFIRTNGTDVEVTVRDSNITVHESEGTKHLVYFRGSNESAKFIDCTISDGWTTAGVDANSTLEVYNFSETDDGLTLVTDGITDEVTLYLVPADYEGTTVNVPEGVDTIGGYAFYYNTNVETIVLPNSVTTLDMYSFRGTSATKVVLNEGLTEIGAYAFSKAGNLKEINFPSTVTTVCEQAFRLAGFETLTIPATVTNIEAGAFRDLSNVTTITVEGNPVIANFAFRSCPNLTTVNLLGNNVTFSGTSQAFCRYDNGAETDQITIYVANQTIADRLAVAQGSAKGYTVVCELTANEDGIYTDATTGEVYAYASDDTELSSAITNGAETVYLSSGAYTFPSSSLTGEETLICAPGTVFEGTSKLNINDATVIGATFSNPTGTAADQTINGTFKDCTFEGKNGLRWCYAGETVVFENCVFSGSVYGIHFDGGANDVLFKNCTFSGFNAMGGAVTQLTMEGCTFVANGKSGYNGINMWGNTTMTNCTFVFDGKAGTEWVDACGDNKTYIFNNCVINDGTTERALTTSDVGDYGTGNTITVN